MSFSNFRVLHSQNQWEIRDVSHIFCPKVNFLQLKYDYVRNNISIKLAIAKNLDPRFVNQSVRFISGSLVIRYEWVWLLCNIMWYQMI